MDSDNPKEIELPLLDKSRKSSSSFQPKTTYSPLSQVIDINHFKSKFAPIKSLLAFLTFLDVYPIAKKMNDSTKKPQIEDTPLPYPQYNIPEKTIELDSNWQEELKKPKPNLLRAIYKTFRNKIWREGFITFMVSNSYIIDTILLGKLVHIIQLVTNGEPFDEQGTYIIGSIFIVSFLFKIFAENYFFYFNLETSTNIKFSLSGLLYKKLNLVSLSSLHSLNLGKVINLIANDLNEIDRGAIFIWPMVLAPYNILASCALMATQFDWFSTVALVLIFASMQLATYISNLSRGMKYTKNALTDSRLKYTHEFIEAIRLIKLYAWEKPIKQVIIALRLKEFDLLKQIGANDAINRATSETSVYFIIFAVSILYVVMGDIISPEKIYTTTALLNFMRRRVLMHFTQGRNFYITGSLLRTRIEDVLMIPEVTSLATPKTDENAKSVPIILKNFSASWKKEDKEVPCLKELTTEFPANKLTVIVGSVGCGKTSLLLSFLGELPIMRGKVSLTGSIAYVEQEPIVFSMSVRDNILFGKEFDEDFYKKVLLACCLDADLEQFDHRDQTIVGERGVTLSGGQKARLSMARALYSNSDIYFLDDPLSAVDARVASHMFEHAIKGLLADKTVVLVTHHLSFTNQADKLIAMDKGKIIAQGSFEEVQKFDLDLLKLLSSKSEVAPDSVMSPTKSPTEKKGRGGGGGGKGGQGGALKLGEKKQEMKREEHREVTWSTYSKYMSYSSHQWVGIFALSLFVATHVFTVWITRFLGSWGDTMSKEYHNSEITKTPFVFDNSYYIILCSCLITAIVIGMYLKGMLIMRYVLDINNNLHNKLLNIISRAVVSFFDETPIGRVLNRFSNSLGVLDKNIWENIYMLSNGFLQNAIFLAYICWATPALGVPALIVVVGFIKVRGFFSKPLTCMKQLDIAARSPLVSEISATIHGLVIVRVYKQGPTFITNFLDLTYTCSRVQILLTRIERGFAMALFFLLYLLVISGIFIFIKLALQGGVDTGMFGLALWYLITVGANLILATRQSLNIIISFQNAENILQFCDIEQEPPELTETDLKLQKSWPSQGEIILKNVSLRYKGTAHMALNRLDAVIPAGTKLGVVGRTGAGKSSLIWALFRMAEIEDTPDSSIEIDGVNTKKIGLSSLRRNLCIIPQTPVILSGTVRRNLDPFEEYSDDQLWDVLEKVNLLEYVQGLSKGLETEVEGSSSVFSAGQKQLVCLARVILKKKKIMIFDEATANVDYSTDNLVQARISEQFKDCTVITVAHRLTTIAHYDKIMVLEKGQIVEFDHPYKLLVKEIGDKEITNTEGFFAQMVLKNDAEVSEKIFQISKKGFLEVRDQLQVETQENEGTGEQRQEIRQERLSNTPQKISYDKKDKPFIRNVS